MSVILRFGYNFSAKSKNGLKKLRRAPRLFSSIANYLNTIDKSNKYLFQSKRSPQYQQTDKVYCENQIKKGGSSVKS
jgi:hypothetical protein